MVKQIRKKSFKLSCNDHCSINVFRKLIYSLFARNYLRRGGNPNVAKNSDTVKRVKEGYSLVHALVAIKNTAALQSVLLAGAKPNVFPLTDDPKDIVTPLVLAAQLGYLNGVRLLIEQAGVDITNSYGPSGENALHAAVQSNSKSVVAYLLKASQSILLRKLDTAGKFSYPSSL